MSKQISVIGCGWLGLPLAKQLVAANYKVKGSTTSSNKIPDLKSNGIDGFYVELTQDGIIGEIETCLSGSEILILNIPSGLRKHPEANFVKQVSLLVPYIEQSSIENVIFVSSTSVYKDEVSIPTITEDTIPHPDTKSGKQLLKVEKLLQANRHFSTTILRFSGLFGPNRHPATYLSGKMAVKNPDAPVNLIHLNDCIKIIIKILEKNVWNKIINASSQPNPSKKEYYTSVCKKLNLSIPSFTTHPISKGKLIDSKKLIQLLKYEFQVKLNN